MFFLGGLIIKIGYACLNTSLNTIFRGVTLKTLEKLKENAKIEKLNAISLININLVEQILEYNFNNNFLLYRLPTNLLPFPTHPISKGWNWKEIFEPCFAHTGKLVKEYGIRISFHADEYTIINSINDLVSQSSFDTLQYLSDVLEIIDKEAKIVIHLGGVYKDKSSSINRFIVNFKKLPHKIQRKLVIENDDKQYDWRDTLLTAEHLKIPMILDIHHHNISNFHEQISKEDVMRIFSTWNGNIPKIHLSSPRSSEMPKAHADYIDPNDFIWFYNLSKEIDYDIMIEAKAKELAAAKFREDLSRLNINI